MPWAISAELLGLPQSMAVSQGLTMTRQPASFHGAALKLQASQCQGLRTLPPPCSIDQASGQGRGSVTPSQGEEQQSICSLSVLLCLLRSKKGFEHQASHGSIGSLFRSAHFRTSLPSKHRCKNQCLASEVQVIGETKQNHLKRSFVARGHKYGLIQIKSAEPEGRDSQRPVCTWVARAGLLKTLFLGPHH